MDKADDVAAEYLRGLKRIRMNVLIYSHNLVFFYALLACFIFLSLCYFSLQKIFRKGVFIVLLFDLLLFSASLLFQRASVEMPPLAMRASAFAVMVLGAALWRFYRPRGEAAHPAVFLWQDAFFIGLALLLSALLPLRALVLAAAAVFYALLALIGVAGFFSGFFSNIAGAPCGYSLFVFALFFPPAFLRDYLPPSGACRFFPPLLLSAMFMAVILSIFEKNNISKKQIVKFFIPMAILYAATLYFSRFFVLVCSPAASLRKDALFLVFSHGFFMAAVLSYFLYGILSEKLTFWFLERYQKADDRLFALSLEIDPLRSPREIFLIFAQHFEALVNLRLKAALILEEEKALCWSEGKEKALPGSADELRKFLPAEAVVPSEFFFRSTFHLLGALRKAGIAEEFGYIVPVRLKGELEGYFITEPPVIREKARLFRALYSLGLLRQTVEKVLLNARQLRYEKEIQDRIMALEEKKRTSDELRKKNDELQGAMTVLKEKQKQLILAEKWASICQVTVSLNHEINNPLTHIMGSSQILKAQMKKPGEISPKELSVHLGKVEEQCQRIKNIIENLRKISEPVAVDYLSDVKMLKIGK